MFQVTFMHLYSNSVHKNVVGVIRAKLLHISKDLSQLLRLICVWKDGLQLVSTITEVKDECYFSLTISSLCFNYKGITLVIKFITNSIYFTWVVFLKSQILNSLLVLRIVLLIYFNINYNVMKSKLAHTF